MYRVILLLTTLSLAFAESSGGLELPPSTSPASPTNPNAADAGSASMMPLLLMGGVFVFMIFMIFSGNRQQKREKQKRQEMLDALKVGVKIITIGGMHGVVVRKGESDIDVRIGIDVNGPVVTFTLNAVASVVDESAA